ncbi:MAG: FAD-binding protein, partial [Candidatus Puniceispirillum sp.]|nr:FAD-binding protein [Candidatus Puniceispirillum sp.]
MHMPEPDNDVIERRDEICATLRTIIPADCVIDSIESMRAFDSDGLSAYRQLPLAVVLPETVDQIADVMKWCHQNGVKVVPRGAGTSLSGGALPLADAVLLGLGK